jgi:hypothetical protein
MYAPVTPPLERRPTAASLVPQAAGLAPTPDPHGPGRQRGHGQSGDDGWPRGWSRSPPPSFIARCPSATDRRPAGPLTGPVGAKPRNLWLSGGALDARPDCRRQLCGIRYLIASSPCGALVQGDPLEPAKTRPPRQAARRSGHCPVAQRDVARHQKKAQAQGHSLFCIDESGFSITPLYAGRGGK